MNSWPYRKLLAKALWIAWIVVIALTCVLPKDLLLFGAETVILLGAIASALLTAQISPAKLKHLVIGGLFILAVLAGQFLNQSALSFPFVSWDMFCTVEYRSPSAIQYKATLANGHEIDFHPAHQVRSISESRVDFKLEQQIALVQKTPIAPEHQKLFAEHQRTLAAFVQLYNTEHKDNPITALSIFKTTLRLRDGQPAPTRESTFLWTIQLGRQS